jgi:hypothetical protein
MKPNRRVKPTAVELQYAGQCAGRRWADRASVAELEEGAIRALQKLGTLSRRGDLVASEAEFNLMWFYYLALRIDEFLFPELALRVKQEAERRRGILWRFPRGRTADSAAIPTQVAIELCFRLHAGHRYRSGLPPFSRATREDWAKAAKKVLVEDFGRDYQDLAIFSKYRKNGQAERVKAGELRAAIWHDIRQSVHTIAPPSPPASGTKVS